MATYPDGQPTRVLATDSYDAAQKFGYRGERKGAARPAGAVGMFFVDVDGSMIQVVDVGLPRPGWTSSGRSEENW